MSLYLHTSNRLEILVDRLSAVVSQPLATPMNQEIIVVQSRGMQQWVSLELAKRLGIWTNCRYPFSNRYLLELCTLLIQDMPDATLFDREVLTWRIIKLLPDCIDTAGFESLRNYLRDGKGYLRAWQLARQIANVFDQYCVFRPKMILRWEAGNGKGWQADLWRLLTRQEKPSHRAARRAALFAALNNTSNENIKNLPPRVSVFGISALPPFYMDVFAALSEFCQVHLFLMNPSREYWADIKSEYEITRTLRKQRTPRASGDDLHLEKGNSLLASMGRLGRDFLGLALDYNPQLYEAFAEPGDDSLLHAVQQDILNMVDRSAQKGEPASQAHLTSEQIQADTSLIINSCHSPMREVEVLYDYLLNIFNNSSDIMPRDILVMAPDIDLYAPFVRAVFDVPEDDAQQIPYFIADQTVRQQSVLVKNLFAILELTSGRFNAAAVLDILECQAVQRRFNLQPATLNLIHQWVRETRMRWGIDASYRNSLGLPEISHNTWKAGIERLLLGYAMPGTEENLFNGILPFDNIEGMNAQILGNFITVVDTVCKTALALENSSTLTQWQDKLLAILDDLFLPDEDEEEDVAALRSTIGTLSQFEAQSGFSEPVERAVITSWLETALREQFTSRSFLTGRVTFCAMLPMRSIPCRVICLLGMNDAAFPRRTTTLSFDLIAQHPRRGDRSQPIDDRYLFLEAIISAREKLYVSYVGQSIQDNSEIPPSVVVSELLDYLEQGYKVPNRKLSDFLVFKQRLQAFSPRYFSPGGSLYSYSQEQSMASQVLLAERRLPELFIKEAIVRPEAEQRIIRLQDLISFFDNPAKFLLNRAIGLYLDEGEAALEDREPFILAGIDKYQLEQQLAERAIAGKNEQALGLVAAAAGMLPHGSVGDATLRSLLPNVRAFSETVRSYINRLNSEPVVINCACEDNSITGIINDLYQDDLIRYRCATVKAKDRLRIWIQHLILNVAKPAAPPRKSILIGTDYVFEAEVLEDGANGYLRSLIETYQKGVRRLVCFFPESSLKYAEALHKGKSRLDAIEAARTVWEGNDYASGERNDPYYALCFKDVDPFTEEFEALSLQTYDPLLQHQIKVR